MNLIIKAATNLRAILVVTNTMIQDVNKVPYCAVVARRQLYESSFWTLKEVYETSGSRGTHHQHAVLLSRCGHLQALLLRILHVAWSVCLCGGHMNELGKNGRICLEPI